jgi:hypothetical protein
MENKPAFNPYTPPQADLDPPAARTSISARASMMKYEVGIRSVGTVFLFIGLILLMAGSIVLAFHREYWIGGLSALAGAAVAFWVDCGLQKLRGSARTVAMILAGIGLLGFPVITLVSLHILFVLGNKSARAVFTPDYARIIAATPHINHKQSPVFRLVLAIAIVVPTLVFLLMSR